MLEQAILDKLARVGLTVYRPDPDAEHRPLPLYLSRIPAGFPSPADDHVERSLDLHRHLLAHPDASFFLRISGDSMLAYGIHDGDLLIVDRAVQAKEGMIVVAALDGELTVKRLGKHAGQPALLPGNDRYAPIPIREGQELVVWGVVIHVIHSFAP
ncbi:LexA family protein [Acidithiobacillus caldus]|nr:translesion error-prone DNA polymerase V autoproteolytic subunit [Acidithiobacillus caldus]MBU2729063.1 translesion error-prone DNA polymerase V autoproteolytic subunit [Acidithiobacillus caldus]MBU2736831.1 translesion error-prone DNA polymerase V autoproteolytic subunit [Acidithiobacillus caldus ATCC 51756]MBU2746308.1 translesion error-prone DNA polymerase V autoproteolytic subunit [Acidithiobacillus caldus]MBU2779770.1 translesion error-prone DNA polymerase V autoproteolytic subunit [Aci